MRTGHVPRFHVVAGLAAGARIELAREAAHHASRVLRLRVGEPMTLFDGTGGEYDAKVASISGDGVAVTVGEHHPDDRESPLRVTLVQGIAGADRMDFIIQKSVELGVTAIQPVLTSKSVVRLSKERGEARLAHWQRIVIAACEQCGRNRIPEVLPALPVAEYEAPTGATKVMLSPQAAKNLKALPQGPLVLAVGPEAGFDATEAKLLGQKGFEGVRLGPRVLRTETAALAALAALNALRGDF